MNEASVVRKIVISLKEFLPQAVVFKLADRVTAGIPDLCVNYRGLSTWLEVKYLRPDESVSKRRKHFDKLQLLRATQLEQQSHCYYLIAYHVGRTLFTAVISPRLLGKALSDDDLDLLTHSIFIGPFNNVMLRLVKLLAERTDVHHSHEEGNQEEASGKSKGEATFALRRCGYFITGAVPARGMAGHEPRRAAKVSAAKQSRRRR